MGCMICGACTIPDRIRPRIFHLIQNNANGFRRRLVKIIVVDDESVIADTLVDILRGEGCQAIAVSDGDAAVLWARIILPDVIISDVMMPGMTGIEAAIVIKEFLPSCRIILFSGQAGTVDLLEKARNKGHEFELLIKPISPNVLLATLGLDPTVVDTRSANS